MEPKEGYVYYISDNYFTDVDDPHLMRNKGDGHRRPCYCCKESLETGLYWMVPLSSQKTKFQKAYAQSVSKYGKCLTLVLGRYAGRDATFLVQNAFPVTKDYVIDIYKINENPVPVHSKLQKIIYGKLQACLAIHRKGHHTIYTDIDKAQKIMMSKIPEKKTSLSEIISSAESKKTDQDPLLSRENNLFSSDR